MLLEKYQKLLTKDIESIISYVFENYQITKNGISVDQQEILNHFIEQPVILQCCGIVQSGSRCTRSSIPGYMYCKTHVMKNKQREQLSKQFCDPIEFISDSSNKIVVNEQRQGLEKIFIDNSFFLRDEKYIYCIKTDDRVGYIDTDNKCILTNDPFILNSF